MNSILRQLASFRLGYAEERPYPWKWTTPIVLGVFLLISAFLAALNVPLSAYNIVQEFTYRPNDTLPTVALSGLVPSMFQHSANSFTPQLLTVGDIIKLNGSLFEYAIVDAFEDLDGTKPVSSFSYYNNPFSDGCDVANITINVGAKITRDSRSLVWFPGVQMLITITCRVPTLFHLVWTGTAPDQDNSWQLESTVAAMVDDLTEFDDWWIAINTTFPNITVFNATATVYPCCNCDTAASPETTTLLEPPCSSKPPQFMATDVYFAVEKPDDPPPDNFNQEVVSKRDHLISSAALGALASQLGNFSEPVFNSIFQNIFQAIYHLVRLDLGVIVDNQIYNSPQMFNLSIMPVDIPSTALSSSANKSPAMTSDPTLMAQWRQEVAFYQTSDRVPIMDYLRPVPRLKPLGSAITSVFVSTFAMLSALWTIFSLGAGALARRTGSQRLLFPQRDFEGGMGGKNGWDTATSSSVAFHKEPAPLHIRVEHVEDDIREMKRMMRLLLDKQGFADHRLDHDLKDNADLKDEILSPLVHRTSTRSNWS